MACYRANFTFTFIKRMTRNDFRAAIMLLFYILRQYYLRIVAYFSDISLYVISYSTVRRKSHLCRSRFTSSRGNCAVITDGTKLESSAWGYVNA